MILFIGQVASDQRDREAFQEVDYRQMFGPGTLGFAKWVGEMHDADRLPEYVARAFHTAMQGRPGPVVLALPEDMLRVADRGAGAAADRARARRAGARGPGRDCASCSPPPSGRSSSPAAAAGRRRRARRCERFAERWQLPVGCALPLPGRVRQPPSELRRRRRHRHQSRSSPHASREADLVLAIGAAPRRDDDRRLRAAGAAATEAEAGPRPCRRRGARPRLRRRPAAAVVDGLRRAGARGARARRRRRAGPTGPRAAHADYEANREPTPVAAARHGRGRAARSHRHAAATTRSTPTAPATSAAGCIASIATRGCATPAAPSSRRRRGRWATACRPRLPRRLLEPQRTVVNLAGDGDFLMNGQELATAIALRRAAAAQHRRRQRHLRHDPHAPGARVSRAACRAAISATPTSPRWRAPTAGGPASGSTRTAALRAGAQRGARMRAGRR